ncbi:multidrug transporter [Arthrobacter sp. MYb23]|uniref:YesL family protein n=1 Tax=unclassified Arthrobacter TaxID=235627 RepID=UPI000CFDAB9C|nr:MULTISPECIES: DUF624 domain-containing protein [unclassified Arthrobacter]PRB43449.1 multidrug transporter [Arthrobacter sp. MYb51]PRB93693.1 multidrug transporter [Arthrobacter sp. MYb23]
MRTFAAGYERFARIVLMVFITNVAFIVHTLLGVVIAGFFPSVAASASTFRTWTIAKDRSWTVRQTWSVFHRAWKAELAAANAFGWPQLVVWLFLAWDYYLANWNYMGPIGIGVSGLVLLVVVLYGVFALNSWVVRANFDERTRWIVRTSLRMVIARPACSLMTIALLLLTAWAWYMWPGMLMAFGFALPLFAAVIVVYSFGRLPGMNVDDRARPNGAMALGGAGSPLHHIATPHAPGH